MQKDVTVGDVHVGTNTGPRKARSFKATLADSKAKPAPAAKVDAPATQWSARFDVAKSDEDQCLVFGWANIVEKDGAVVTDRQGDQIDIGELERAVYDYALFKRTAGEMHERTSGVGQMVESVVMTVEKQKAMGLAEGSTPLGWWVGFKLEADVFAKIKDKTYSMFSIGGAALREGI